MESPRSVVLQSRRNPRADEWLDGAASGKNQRPSHRTHRGPPTATLPTSVGTTTRTLRPRGMAVTRNQYPSRRQVGPSRSNRDSGIPVSTANQPSSVFDGDRSRPRSCETRIGIAPSQRSGVTSPTPRTTEKRAGAETADRKYAGDGRQVADDHSRGHADRHLPRLNECRRSLHVPRPYEPAELPGTGPAGRGVPQDRIGESERGECREVPEFVSQHRYGEGDRAAGHASQLPDRNRSPTTMSMRAPRVINATNLGRRAPPSARGRLHDHKPLGRSLELDQEQQSPAIEGLGGPYQDSRSKPILGRPLRSAHAKQRYPNLKDGPSRSAVCTAIMKVSSGIASERAQPG